MKRNYILIAMSCVLLAACSSGKKRLEQGDYDTAVYKAVKRLQQKPQFGKAEKVLREAYTRAVNEHMEVIAYHDNSDNQYKYDNMLEQYKQINYLNTAIRRYPLYADLLTLTDVKEELAFVQGEAALVHKLEGEDLLKLRDKKRARDAYHHFVRANKILPGAVPARLMDIAQEAGTMNVVLEFSNRSPYSSYNTDKVWSEVMNNFKNTRYRFLRVVEPGEIDNAPDEIVQIIMEDAHIGGVDFRKNVFEVTKDNVYMGEAETDSGEVVKVYGTVTADYIEFCKTINSRASLHVQRMDGETAVVHNRQIFPSSYNWTEKWATYRGDKRALSTDQLNFARRSEPNPPGPEWMFAQVSKPLVGRSISFLRDQYGYLR